MTVARMREEARVILRGRIPASDEAVSAVLGRLGRTLAALGAREEARADILLALAEILNNIIEHSVAGMAEPHIHLTMTQSGPRIQVEIVDHGRPLPLSLLSAAALPAMPNDPLDIDALPEGGFGWFIIHELAQDMTYEREGGANMLSFHFAT